MIPTDVLLDRIALIVSQDTGSLAPASLALHVKLAIAPFTPGPALSVGSFTEATFTGYGQLLAGVGPQQNFKDPATNARKIQLLEPAGGWHWGTTSATGLPQTVYGYYVVDNANAVLYGSALLPVPVTLTATGQGVDVGNISIAIPPGVIF